jgi:hypothetical protein
MELRNNQLINGIFSVETRTYYLIVLDNDLVTIFFINNFLDLNNQINSK